MAGFLALIILWIIANIIWPKNNNRGNRTEGDNYIILSELEQDYGKHEKSNEESIFDDEGDSDF